MSKYVKLGPNAAQGSFFDPVSRLSLVPGSVAEVPKAAKNSKIYADAIKNNHIVPATSEEFEEYTEKQDKNKEREAATSKKEKKASPKPAVDEDEDEEEDDNTEEDEQDEEDEDEEDDADTMTKAELVASLEASSLGDDVKKTLNKLSKPELIQLYKKQTKK